MNTKIIAVASLIGVLTLSGAFYGGMTYAQMSRGGSGGNFANLSIEERQARFAGGGSPMGMRDSGGVGAGFTSGDILSKDATSLTIKMMDGSTKIVLFSGSTMISKSASGTPADLTTGARVTVMGNTNSDGSVTAQDILIGGGFGFGRMGAGAGGQMPRRGN